LTISSSPSRAVALSRPHPLSLRPSSCLPSEASKAPTTFRRVIEAATLKGRRVLEIGAGTGVITRLILAQDPRRVYAFEIEAGLCRVRDPRLDLLECDASSMHPVMMHANCLVSAPPYSLLPVIHEYLEQLRIGDAILCVPPSKLDLFEGFSVEDEMGGAAFDPPAEGSHLLIRKGFA